jgi:hypothetical protein
MPLAPPVTSATLPANEIATGAALLLPFMYYDSWTLEIMLK